MFRFLWCEWDIIMSLNNHFFLLRASPSLMMDLRSILLLAVGFPRIMARWGLQSDHCLSPQHCKMHKIIARTFQNFYKVISSQTLNIPNSGKFTSEAWGMWPDIIWYSVLIGSFWDMLSTNLNMTSLCVVGSILEDKNSACPQAPRSIAHSRKGRHENALIWLIQLQTLVTQIKTKPPFLFRT